MKIDLDFLGRAYLANLARRRSMECSLNADTTTLDKQRVDWEEEARYAADMAIRLDDGEELAIDRRTPIVARPNLDTEYLTHRENELPSA